MPTVFRHARRRSRYHARLHEERQHVHAARHRRPREGTNPRHFLDEADDWQREWRRAVDNSDAPDTSSRPPSMEHEDDAMPPS